MPKKLDQFATVPTDAPSGGIACLALACVSLVLAPSVALAAQGTDETTSIDLAAERQFWSFRPPVQQARPAVRHGAWPRQAVDFFVLDRLEQGGLTPSPEANRRTLVRRLAFDLTGLPATPEEVDAFLRDDRPDAYERLVDGLLESPRFGERMASLWLPLARYAEDQAHQVGSDTKFFYPNAYKYRAWVIDAFNRDLPYDQFITLQLAADKVEGVAATDLAALGFLGLGPKYYNRNRLDVMSDEWEDRVDTVTRTFLGLTVGCARCHDHKFEPITMADYYGLAGVFASTKMVNRRPNGEPEKGDATADKMDPDTLHVVEDGDVQNLNVFLRGNVEQKGPIVERRFLSLLTDGEPLPFRDGSGRKELAAAIASRSNPLTARVFVNRVWATFFGRGLVSTPSNLGHSGQPPTHPELLDDLAARFMENGWSVKSLVRELVLSATYRQTARTDARKAAVDPANELLWRMNRRRLSVEQWRDAVLFVSGQLDSSGGKSLELDEPTNRRRTVYARVSRLKLNDLLMQFDYPDANVHAEKRAVTTTPTQRLFMLNSPFMLSQSQSLSERLAAEATDDAARVRHAYRLLFSRTPEIVELELALEFLQKPTESLVSRCEQYAQMLLASNEMLYVD
jgi:hypothetical protein